MFKPALFTLLILPSLPAHALDTQPLAPEQLLTLGAKLAAHAGSNQWQQLWQRTRAAGHLQPEPGRAYFTLSQAQLPQLARETLTKADQVEAQNNTFALYRRAFPGQVVGMLDEQPLNAFCLVIDWRSLPQNMADSPYAYLSSASLVQGYPCP